jgi:tetratricopeptide (TPR) repeat protein
MELGDMLPAFDEDWISQSHAIVAARGGILPDLNFCRREYVVDADRIVVDEEIEEAITNYVQECGSDLPNRFAALNYLWIARFATSASREENDSANRDSSREVHRALLRLVDRLDPESVSTPVQAKWEFKQAFILQNWDRLNRLGQRRQKLEGMSSDDLNLLIGRAFWFPNSRHWARVLQFVGDSMIAWSWEAILDGDRLTISNAAAEPPESHETPNRDLIVAAIASLRKVSTSNMGPHWGILADCEAMTGSPDQCASIWEEHGAEILHSLAETVGCSGADALLRLPDYQLRIADLWEEAGRPEKAIEALESLRRTNPRLEGVNRRLAELYIGRKDLDTAVQRFREEADCDKVFRADPIVQSLLWALSGSEARTKSLEKYQSSPSSIGQRTAIRNVLRLAWRPLDQLSPSVQEDWVTGLWWCHGEHSGEFPETERADEAVLKCARAVETHLRERIFEQLRETAKQTDIHALPKGFQPLQAFLLKKHIDLGVMLDAIQSAFPNSSGVLKTLWDLLHKRSSSPHSLRDARFDGIRRLRNPGSHDSRWLPSIPEAMEYLSLCEEFLSILEQPPQPRPDLRRKG